MVLLKADPFPSRWCVTCARHADAILLVAAAEDDEAPGPHEGHALQARLLGGVHGGVLAQRDLVLLHNSTEVTPTGTRPWLEAFRLAFFNSRTGNSTNGVFFSASTDITTPRGRPRTASPPRTPRGWRVRCEGRAWGWCWRAGVRGGSRTSGF